MDNTTNENVQNSTVETPVEATPAPVAPAAPEAPAKKKGNSKIIIIIVAIAVLAAVAFGVYTAVTPGITYKNALKLVESGDYAQAILDFEQVTDKYADANTYISYANALIAYKDGKYDDAITAFTELGDFEDSAKYLNDTYYAKAEALYNDGSYAKAKTYYEKATESEDAAAKIKNCDFMEAETAYKDGELKKAQELFKALPADLTVDNISVKDRLATLDKNANLVKLCGSWKSSDGKMSVRQTHKSTGLWDQWDGTFYDYITVKIILNDDGTFTIKGTAKYYTYTNYSSLSYQLKTSERSISFEKTGTSIPTELYSGASGKLTFNGSQFKLTYDYTNANYSMNFTYRFKSSATYNVK